MLCIYSLSKLGSISTIVVEKSSAQEKFITHIYLLQTFLIWYIHKCVKYPSSDLSQFPS